MFSLHLFLPFLSLDVYLLEMFVAGVVSVSLGVSSEGNWLVD